MHLFLKWNERKIYRIPLEWNITSPRFCISSFIVRYFCKQTRFTWIATDGSISMRHLRIKQNWIYSDQYCVLFNYLQWYNNHFISTKCKFSGVTCKSSGFGLSITYVPTCRTHDSIVMFLFSFFILNKEYCIGKRQSYESFIYLFHLLTEKNQMPMEEWRSCCFLLGFYRIQIERKKKDCETFSNCLNEAINLCLFCCWVVKHE